MGKKRMKTQGKIKSILLAAFAALVLGGCKDGDNPFYAPNETKIIGDIAFSDTICGIPMAIDSSVVPFFHRSVDEYFVVANSGNTKLFSVYDSQSDSLIAQFGTIGHANDEFPSSPANFYFGENEKGDKLLYVPDCEPTKGMVVNLSASIKSDKCIMENTIKYEDPDINIVHYFLPDDKELQYHRAGIQECHGERTFSPSRISMKSGEETMYDMATYPNIIPGDPAVLDCIYMLCSTISPNRKKLLEISYCMDWFTIVDIASGKTLGVMYGEDRNPECFKSVSGMGFEDAAQKLVMYNLDFCATDAYVFIMYNDKYSISDVENDPATCYSHPQVMVYDWEGNLVSSFVLDKAITQMDYNDKSKIMYGKELETDGIYKFDLSGKL